MIDNIRKLSKKDSIMKLNASILNEKKRQIDKEQWRLDCSIIYNDYLVNRFTSQSVIFFNKGVHFKECLATL